MTPKEIYLNYNIEDIKKNIKENKQIIILYINNHNKYNKPKGLNTNTIFNIKYSYYVCSVLSKYSSLGYNDLRSLLFENKVFYLNDIKRRLKLKDDT